MHRVKRKGSTPHDYRRFFRQAKYLVTETLQDTWFQLVRKTMAKRLIIVVGTSHRVGSTWLCSMLRDMTHCRLGRRQAPAELMKFGTLVLEPEAYKYLRQLQGHIIFKSHSPPPNSQTLADTATFISIYRDPRDVLVSASFYVAHLEEKKGGWGESFRNLAIPDRIQLLIEHSERLDLFSELEQWFNTPFAYKTSYKDLRHQPVEELWKIAEMLDISTTKKALKKISLKHSFKTQSSKKHSQSRENLSLRKGIIGDWRNHFDQACITAFKTKRDGCWNRLLVKMGYENSLDWK
jgi:hypothetical protein